MALRLIQRTTIIGFVAVSCIAASGRLATAASNGKIDTKGKIVLANVDKFPAHFRIGKVKKTVAPKKASVLSPKQLPVTLEIWTGTPGQAKWRRKSISTNGVYTFRFQRGRWSLTKPQPRRRASSSQTVRSRRPSYRRATGSRTRVARNYRRPAYRNRVPLLRRVAGDVMGIYRFVRDEEDRDLLRDIIVGREIDREIKRDLLERLDDMAVNLPADDRREFERSFRDLNALSERDIKDLEASTDEDWGQVRESFGDEVADNAWQELESGFNEVQIDDLSNVEINELDDAGIESLDSDVDIGDLGGGEADLVGELDSVDLGDLGGEIDNVDLGDLGGVEAGDFGGDVGGGFDAGGADLNAGGFDNFDAGGFDDFGGGVEDFGGGGMDDFGGGGFDDFGGGGFDDF